MNIKIKSLSGCTIDDIKEIGKVHIESPIDDHTLCGDALEEFEIQYTKEKITCKKCIKIIRYCKGLDL